MSRFRDKLIWIQVNLCRLLLSCTFVLSGFVKAVDPKGTEYKLVDYAEAFHLASWIPDYVYLPVAILLSVFEFSLGVYLFFGIRRRITAWLSLLTMAIMTPLTLYLAIANPVSDCGCFGDAFVLTNWQTFYKNVLLLAAACAVFAYHRLVRRFVSERNQWVISMYSIFFIWIFAGWNVYRLPVLDFRPYYIGADIAAGMSYPEDAKLPEFQTTFIMEKNGEQKEFTEEEYPDSTWRFVDSRTVMIEKGYEPPIHDFSIVSYDTHEDITEQVLQDTSYTFLVVAPFLQRADDGNIDRLNEVYDYCRDYGYAFYCLTASGEDAILRWQEFTGAEYPFCFTDETTLKTIVRSNPGLVLLKHGVIYNKWSCNDLPEEKELSGPLEQIPIGRMAVETVWYRMMKVILWYLMPLLLFILGDRLWIGKKVYKIRQHKKRVLNLIKQQENEKKNCSR